MAQQFPVGLCNYDVITQAFLMILKEVKFLVGSEECYR